MVVARPDVRRLAVAAAGLAGLLAIAGCTSTTAVSSGTDPSGAASERTTSTTIAAATTTEKPAKARPKPTTTTAAPTTTQVPQALLRPLKPLPDNVVSVKPLSSPLSAVGTSGGSETQRVQQRLLELGFWLSDDNGSYDLTTLQAVMAFQKYLGLPATGSVDSSTAAFMSNVTERAHGQANAGTIIEVDKHRQVIFFVVDGKVAWVFNTSTGNGKEYTEADQNTPGETITGVSLTPDGLHYVNRERPEGWWEGDLGQIYRPKYFVGGVAIHGSNSVPNYPASHGCVRVTVPAMDFIWDADLMAMYTPVWVHGDEPA